VYPSIYKVTVFRPSPQDYRSVVNIKSSQCIFLYNI